MLQLKISLPEVTGHSMTTSETPVNISTVPKNYHDFADIFSKSKAGKLADHQPYNLKNTLDKGTSPPYGLIYSFSQEELATLHKFIYKKIDTGLICPSCSPHGAQVLFIQKKDGSLQICVNFQVLRIQDSVKIPIILSVYSSQFIHLIFHSCKHLQLARVCCDCCDCIFSQECDSVTSALFQETEV